MGLASFRKRRTEKVASELEKTITAAFIEPTKTINQKGGNEHELATTNMVDNPTKKARKN